MDQNDFIRRVTELSGRFAWMLGAGASQSAGLPTAIDIIWDLKRRYYCSEEQQDISENDLQNSAIKEKIDAYMASRGIPATSDPTAYSRSFELIFGTDLERQRNYLQAMLSEKTLSLTAGHRAFAGLIACGSISTVFTTNFDTVVERAFADVAGKSIAPFHLEGAYAAKAALDNDQFPIYCKLHGDFRYISLKNLPADLQAQDLELGKCVVTACNRFGLIIAGYSGRDESIMQLLDGVLDGPNPFPHGLYWTRLKGHRPHQAVIALLEKARAKGVRAELIEIETFDSLLARLWKQTDNKDPALITKIGRIGAQRISIPLTSPGTESPILRMNALPITQLPSECLELRFAKEKEWADLHAAGAKSNGAIVSTKGRSILAWGSESSLREAFGPDLQSATTVSIEKEILDLQSNQHVKGFMEHGIALALMRGKPLLYRVWRGGSVLILDRSQPAPSTARDIARCTGDLHGIIPGLITLPTPEHPKREQVSWAEAIKLDFEVINGKYWLVLRPILWIWPRHARIQATAFLDRRVGGRFNKQADALLSAWLNFLLPTNGRAAEMELVPIVGTQDGNYPRFIINGRTAFTRRAAA